MTEASWLLPAILLSSAIPAATIFFLNESSTRTRTALNIGGALLKIAFVAMLVYGVAGGTGYEVRWQLVPNIDLVLHADALSLLFITLSSVLWLVTTIYAIGYLENSPQRSRFFGFFSLCVCATVGIALAGNLVTFIIFYELLTLTTYPLVVHRGTAKARRAGRIYLTYTLGGGALLVAGVAWLKAIAGPLDFTATGILSSMTDLDVGSLRWIFLLLMVGFGVKAAIVPLHGWLPLAMVAPAPVSSLLHAVAVVKAGAFGIVRVVYDVYGVEFANGLGLLMPLAVAAAITILYGSLRAVFQTEIKPRLAYSTVSQVSYIALGAAIAGPLSTVGGLVHLVHQGLMKITLFFCAGNFAETLKVHSIDKLDGIGRRMPLTMTAFTIGALGMIGVPPIAGFVSKWYLGSGALEAGQLWVLWVLAGSSILNAIYFLPLLYRGWCKPPVPGAWHETIAAERFETHWMLLFPPLITAALALAAGTFAASALSPLEWSSFIASLEYR